MVAAYIAYGTPIILLGVWHYRRRSLENEQPPGEEWDPPAVSVLVAVKNEETVVGRLLWALSRLDYPKENLEVIVAEDGSVDRTLDVCREYAERLPWIRVFHRDVSRGKADALNFAFGQSKGEIIATFDADAVPEPSCIGRALRYFDRPEVSAVYGQNKSLNPSQSLISRLLTYEMFLYGMVNYAKSRLGLFVTFSGSNTFLRRSALEQVGLWDPKSLVEDIELAVRFLRSRMVTRLAPIVSWDEMPASVLSLVRQRIRWSGGNFQVGAKHWDAWWKMSWLRALDMNIILMGPVVAILLVVGGVLAGLGMIGIGATKQTLAPLLIVMALLGSLLLGSLAVTVLSEGRLGKMGFLKMVLGVGPYAIIVALADSLGMLMVMLGLGGRMWYKTPKTGHIEKPVLLPASSTVGV